LIDTATLLADGRSECVRQSILFSETQVLGRPTVIRYEKVSGVFYPYFKDLIAKVTV
jgi:hypothetical protein